MEDLRGVDLTPLIAVDRPNCIEVRLEKMLEFLQANHPEQNWGQFLSGTNVIWNKVIVAGHSQAAGFAGFIAKQYEVDRAIMIDGDDWWNPEERPVVWQTQPGATPPDRYFGLAHTNDPLMVLSHQIASWSAYDIDQFGPDVFVENFSGAPYDCSHMLHSAGVPRNISTNDNLAYHGFFSHDSHTPLNPDLTPVLKPVWEYVMTYKTICNPSFDGDSRSDLALYLPRGGTWYLRQSVDGYEQVQFGSTVTDPVEADYDGDRVLDVAVFDPRADRWYLMQSIAGFTNIQFGYGGTQPVEADYDGDGRDDIAVYDPNSSLWYIQRSRDGLTSAQFGFRSVDPVEGDYDGDGKSDLAVYNDATGTWYINQTRDGFKTAQFGFNGTIPVQGDYDGDGKTDLAVFDPGPAQWYVQQSLNGFTSFQFGFQGVTAVVRDFDEDGKDDPGVYYGNTGMWYLMESKDGFQQIQFGFAGPIPIGAP
jgi:hypothetical protein